MIKYLFLILPITLDLELSQAQIPNGGFELWEEEFNYEKPIDWSTNQDTLYPRFEKDTISIEGDYSLKIISGVTSSWVGCESRAGMRVDFNKALPSNSVLTFYAKSIPFDSVQNNNVYLRVYVYAFDSNTPLNTYVWIASTALQEFTKVEIPMSDENINAVSIYIYGGASSHPLDGPCLNRSTSWIDGMVIGSVTSDGFSPLLNPTNVSVYPNPSNGIVQVRNVDGNNIRYELYSLIGQLISKGRIENDELTIHEKGTYMLRLLIDENVRNLYSSTIVIVN